MGDPDATHAGPFRAALAARDLTAAMRIASRWVRDDAMSAEGHNALGNVQIASGDPAAAVCSFRRATELAPSLAKAFSNLGGALRTRGDLPGATAALTRAVELDPENFRAWSNLGNTHRQAGRRDEAEAAYRRAVALGGATAATHQNFGSLLAEGGRVLDAVEHFTTAIRLDPQGRDAHAARRTLADILVSRGQREQARAVLDSGLAVDASPTSKIGVAEALLALAGPDQAERVIAGLVLDETSRGPFWTLQRKLRQARGDIAGAEEAATAAAEALRTAAAWCEVAGLRRLRQDGSGVAEALRRARDAEPLAGGPDLFEGDERLARGDRAGAEASFRRASRLAPALIEADANLAKIACLRGDVEGSIELLRSVLGRRPSHAVVHSNLLCTLHYRPPDPERMLEEHLAWSRTHTPFATPCSFAPRAPSASRKLRLGYLSADLRDHAVSRFFEPLLAAHDRSRFAVTLYDASAEHDAFTARMRGLGDAWREVHGASDAEVARRIRADGIDVLVDLGGHTADARLAVLAERPAPVLASFLGYPDTTGMAAVDLRLTDAWADPPGPADRLATEALVRLPRTAWCFRPDERSPPVTARPPGSPLVFGVFNNVAKVSEEARRVFAEVLLRLPDSRLVFKGRGLDEPATRRRFLAGFEAAGVAERVVLGAWAPDHGAHLAAYSGIDIALDTFPYAGTTSTCEALWMGVPVISMRGATHASRVGLSLLTAVGLEHLVAADAAGYAELAVRLASDRSGLAALRAGLRERMAGSPLTDATSYARAVESALLEAFERWRASAVATDGAVDLWLPLADGAVVSVPDDPHEATRFVLEERGDGLEPELDFVRALLLEGERALDVGASFGVYALVMARRVGPEGRVLAFELSPTTAAHLRRSAARAPALHVVEADILPLDAHLDELAGLTFARVDAAGGEVAVLRGAAALMEREDPIWQWRLPHGHDAARPLLDELARSAPHLALMRWVAHLGALVPLDADAALDARWLNVVALSAARRASLVARGLSVEGPIAEGAPPPGDPVEGALRARARASAAPTVTARYQEAMAALGAGRRAFAESPTPARGFLLARVAHEAGFDGEATAVLDAVLQAVRAGGSPLLDGGTVAPLPAQDARRAALDPAIAVEALALEALLTLGARSSFDAADLHREKLERLAALGSLTPALSRMREVLARFRDRSAG